MIYTDLHISTLSYIALAAGERPFARIHHMLFTQFTPNIDNEDAAAQTLLLLIFWTGTGDNICGISDMLFSTILDNNFLCRAECRAKYVCIYQSAFF